MLMIHYACEWVHSDTMKQPTHKNVIQVICDFLLLLLFQPNNNQTSGYTMERLVQKTKQERDKPII